jgi:surface antigen
LNYTLQGQVAQLQGADAAANSRWQAALTEAKAIEAASFTAWMGAQGKDTSVTQMENLNRQGQAARSAGNTAAVASIVQGVGSLASIAGKAAA